MQSKPLLLLPALALACATVFPATGRAQAQREVAAELHTQGYLYFLGGSYYLNVDVPAKSNPGDVPTKVTSFTVERKFTQKGTFEIQDVKLECQGVGYTAPAQKMMVIDERPKAPGFYIFTAPDPNGSGNVELLVCWNGDKKPEPDYPWLCDDEARPKGIDVIHADGSGGGAAEHYEMTMFVLLRNNTGAPFTVTRKLFKNLPPVKDWPEVVIPPTNAK